MVTNTLSKNGLGLSHL